MTQSNQGPFKPIRRFLKRCSKIEPGNTELDTLRSELINNCVTLIPTEIRHIVTEEIIDYIAEHDSCTLELQFEPEYRFEDVLGHWRTLAIAWCLELSFQIHETKMFEVHLKHPKEN